ncbi:MAG TPA: TetR/AcrR family transcriptional regulator [Polyangiales bacterium]|nr:TetR/AcrR family transcriptional regulator [Polyangiales bacterium]
MEIQQESRISAKRQAILDAATTAFRDEGFDCTSMDRIAELAGASKRTVYNHFESKEALFQAVVGRLFDQGAALEQVVWDPDRPLEHQLADFARTKMLRSEDPASLCLMRVALGVFIKHPELVQAVMARSAAEQRTLVRWLRSAVEAGRLDVPDAELAASVFWAMAGGAFFWPQLIEGRLDEERRDALMREVVDTFLARYRPAQN